MQTDLLYQDDAVNPLLDGNHLKACPVVETDGMKPSSFASLKVLKHSMLIWGPDVWSVLETQPGVMQ